jgi:hypothetical protein
MAHMRFTQHEMLGQYIEVDGPSTEGEVLGVLTHLLDPQSVARAADCPPVVTLGDGRTIMFVDIDPGLGCSVLLAVGHLDHDDGVREQWVDAIEQALKSGTSWRLRHHHDTRRDSLVMNPTC